MLVTLIVLIIYFHLLFLFAVLLKDNSIADIGWGFGFIVIDLSLFMQQHNNQLPQRIISLLIILWGARLTIYLFLRKRGQPEDFRYQQWRKSWKKFFLLRAYVQIYWLQMLLMCVVALPLFLMYHKQQSASILTYVGSLIASIGLIFESVSDYQMAQFKKNLAHKGQVIQIGLWRYSRHPNYFGEALFWWGIAIICLPLTRYGTWLISPIAITVLVRYISGVPMLEKKYSRHSSFQDYAARTSCFIPWWPKKGTGDGTA